MSYDIDSVDEGTVEDEEYRKSDLIKAAKLILYSVLSAAVVTIILYYLPF